MKIFVAVAGTMFGMVVVLHLWRVAVEPGVASDFGFWLITGVAAILSAWAWVALARSMRG
jgi:hypothetical protein